MSSIATTADNSAARKSLIGDDDDSLNIKEEMNYLIKEVDTLNANMVEKNREIDYLTSRLQDQIELEKIIADLEKKLQQALSENHEMKETQAATQSQIQSKYIEKSQHNKEIVELKAKANYLTSENERLNKIINSKLEAWQTRGGDRDDSGPDEDEKSELVGKLESYTKENERLLKTVEDNAIEILEWKNKNTDLEAEISKLKAHMKEDEEEISALKKENEEMEKHIVELKAKKERLEHEHDQSKGEHDKLVKSVEAKKKEIEEMKSKMAALEKKDVELGYLKERFQLTVKDNEDLHMKIATKEYEIETLESRCEEFDKKLALIKELEGTINKLNIEKDEFVIRLESKNKKLEEQKEINQNLLTELSEAQANLGFMEDENNELRQITEGYERMIEDLKNTVVKGEKGTYRVLSFDPDSLA